MKPLSHKEASANGGRARWAKIKNKRKRSKEMSRVSRARWARVKRGEAGLERGNRA